MVEVIEIPITDAEVPVPVFAEALVRSDIIFPVMVLELYGILMPRTTALALALALFTFLIMLLEIVTKPVPAVWLIIPSNAVRMVDAVWKLLVKPSPILLFLITKLVAEAVFPYLIPFNEVVPVFVPVREKPPMMLFFVSEPTLTISETNVLAKNIPITNEERVPEVYVMVIAPLFALEPMIFSVVVPIFMLPVLMLIPLKVLADVAGVVVKAIFEMILP